MPIWSWFPRGAGSSGVVPPATPTLAVSDNANDTGGVATITGADSGATVTVYTAPLSAGTSVLVWTAQGSRTGNGTISLSMAAGYYYGYAKAVLSGLPATGVPIIFSLTRATRSNLDRVLDAAVARIQTLSLPAISPYTVSLTADRVVRFDEFSEMVLPLIQKPSVVVCTGKNLEHMSTGTTSKDDVGIPFAVVTVDHGAPQNLVPFQTWELWGERISRGMRWQHLSSITDVWSVKPQNYTPHSWSGPEGAKGFDIWFNVQPFIAISREPRGI